MDSQETNAVAKGQGRKRKEREEEVEKGPNKRGRTTEVCGRSGGTHRNSSIQKTVLKTYSDHFVIRSPDDKFRDIEEKNRMNRLERRRRGFEPENCPSRVASTHKVNNIPGRLPMHQEELRRHQEWNNPTELERMDFPSRLGRGGCDKEKERRFYDQKADIGHRNKHGKGWNMQGGTCYRCDDMVTRRKSIPSLDVSSPTGLYGDVVTMCSGVVIIVEMGLNLYNVMQEEGHPKRHIAPFVYAVTNFPTVIYFPIWISWFLDKGRKDAFGIEKQDLRLFASRAGFLGCLLSTALTNVVNWPYPGECTVTAVFQGGAIMGVLANVSLSFREKIIRLMSLFIFGSIVSIHSPYSIYMEDTLPRLGGTVLLAIVGLYCWRLVRNSERNSMVDKSKSQSPTTLSPSKPDGLYGDIVVIFTTFAIVPDMGMKAYQEVMKEDDDAKPYAAVYICAASIFPLFFLYPAQMSWWWNQRMNTQNRNNGYKDFRLFASRILFVSCVFFNSLMNLLEWPYTGECTITSLFQGGTVMGVLANISLSFREKIIRLATLFVVGSIVSIQSPYSVYTEDTLPILGGTTLLASFGLYCIHFGVKKGIATVLLARLFLAAIYIHHTVKVITSINLEQGFSAYDNIQAMVKASVIACIGIIATGTFEQEIWHKEQLEVVIHDRTNELRVQNEKLDMVNMALQATETAIAITEETGRIIWFNSAFKKMDNNQNDKTMVGRPLKDVVYNIDPTRKTNKYIVLEALDNIIDGNYDSDSFTKNLRQEEEIQIGSSTFQFEATPFLYVGNVNRTKSRRVLVAFKDVTEARARERAEKSAQEEAMMAKAMGDSMVTLTHELRTPLQGIMGITSLLLQGHELSYDAMESLKLIMASSSLLLNLINNLLDVKKATSKMLEEFPLASVPASGPINDSVLFCQPLASISDVNIITDISDAPSAIVQSNSLRLQQVLINLVSNAIKYSGRGSEIIVSVKESTLSDVRSRMASALACSKMKGRDQADNSVLIFCVSDSGPGITPEQAHRLFRRFAQLDTKPKRTLGTSKIGQPSGTGLGLHLCELFVKRMHGNIWATNNDGNRGCTFSFSLPLLSNSKSDDGLQKRRTESRQTIVSDAHLPAIAKENKQVLNQLQVLLVDDTLINRKVIARILKRIGFTNVTSVDSGQNALTELSRAKNYDLVVSDLQMPGMSGTELTEVIFNSSSDDFQQPVVIGITADTSLETAAQCRTCGMSDLLYKPITVEEMKTYIEKKLPMMQPGIWYNEEKRCA